MGLRDVLAKIRRWWARRSSREGLYSRLEGAEVLEHKVRRAMLKALKRQPGLSFPDLQDLTGLSSGTVEWHLKKLEKEGFITASRDGRTRRYFPKATPPDLKKAVVLLRDPSRRELAHRVLRNPRMPQKTVARDMGLSHATVHHHAKRLQRENLLAKVKDGRTVGYEVPEDARKTVEEALRLIPPDA